MAEYSTAQDFIEQVRREIRDEDKLRHTDQDLISYLNRALRQVAAQIAHLWPKYQMRTDMAASKQWNLLNTLNDSDFQWSASGSGTSEYYVEAAGGGDPSLNEPEAVYEDGEAMSEGTAGSLSSGEWDWADNDSLGYNTVYVRLSDDTDPDAKSAGYVKKDKERYDLPTDLYEIMVVTVRGDVMPLLDYEVEYVPGNKVGYILEDDQIVISPTPDTEGTLEVKYVKQPTTVSAVGDNVDYADEFPDVVTQLMCIMATGTDDEKWAHHSKVHQIARKQMEAHVARTNMPTDAKLGIDVHNNWI